MMMKTTPTISVVVPVYNGESFLEECLMSLCTQTLMSKMEVIIVDDGSRDRSNSIAREFVDRFPQVSLFELQHNAGLPRALNFGFANATGAYYSWISCDNFVVKDYFEKMLSLLISNEVDILYSNYDVVDQDGQKIKEKSVDDLAWLPRENCFGPSFIYRKQVHEFLRGFNEEYFLFEDYDFIFRAFEKKFTYRFVVNQGYSFRSHTRQLTQTRRLPNQYYEFRARILDLSSHLSRWNKVVCLFHMFKFCVIRNEPTWGMRFATQALLTNPLPFLMLLVKDIIRLGKQNIAMRNT